jgi:predicted flap endonuclease-1-like 5' DNA nuclease
MANYKISDIEGIGPTYAEKLRNIKIQTVNALLEKGATRGGRKGIAETTGIDETLILKWVNAADLYRVKGVGSEYSQLLEKAGVDTVKELRNRNAENFMPKSLKSMHPISSFVSFQAWRWYNPGLRQQKVLSQWLLINFNFLNFFKIRSIIIN